MSDLYITALDKNDGSVKEQLVQASPPNCEVRLEPLPGASALHVRVRVGHSAVRLEIEPDSEGLIPLQVTWSEERILRLASGPRTIVTLPDEERYAPGLPLRPVRDSGKLDLLFLIDGTTKTLANSGKGPGFAPLFEAGESGPRDQLAQKLGKFVAELGKSYSNIRTGVMAFGDHSMRFISSAPDLTCRYLFYPETPAARKLRPYNANKLNQQITRLPHSSGGDFVDALSEALHECRQVGWRTDARRILMLCGDSPGFSLLDSAPPGADIHVRHVDLYAEAMRLHADHKVEILTLYMGFQASAENNPYTISARKALEFLNHARAQYEKLASLPTLSWDDSTFDPEVAALAVQAVPERIARGACWGALEPGSL